MGGRKRSVEIAVIFAVCCPCDLAGDHAAVTAMLDCPLHDACLLKCGPHSWRTHRTLGVGGLGTDCCGTGDGSSLLRLGAESVQPVLAKESGAFISAICLAETEAQKHGLHGGKLKRWRSKKVPPLAAKLRTWMDAVEPWPQRRRHHTRRLRQIRRLITPNPAR